MGTKRTVHPPMAVDPYTNRYWDKMNPERELDWARIREEWEHSDASDAILARRWGFKSKTSIERRRVREGWTRDIEAITSTLVTAAVADGATAATPATPPPPQPAAAPASQFDVASEPPGRPRSVQAAQRDTDDARALGQAQNLAQIHVAAIREQVALGDTAIATAAAWIGHLGTLATSCDEGELTLARDRLLAVNRDKDTLSSITKSVTQLLEAGIKIKRLALAMDVVRTPNDQPAASGGRQVSEVIRRLDVQTLMQMRGVAQDIARLPPQAPTIEGDAA